MQYIFTIPGVTCFLSQRLCQDPLERFFGLQRQRGGVHDNPNAKEFRNNTQALRVVNSVARAPKRGNCRKGKQDTSLSNDDINEPLPKRPRRSKKC